MPKEKQKNQRKGEGGLALTRIMTLNINGLERMTKMPKGYQAMSIGEEQWTKVRSWGGAVEERILNHAKLSTRV